jgi:hypothetical protein
VRGSQKTVGLLINIGADFTENSLFSQGSPGVRDGMSFEICVEFVVYSATEIGQIWLER